MKNFKLIGISQLIITVLFILNGVLSAQITMDNVAELQNIDVIEHLGEKIPLDLPFIDEQGDTVLLADFLSKDKPVLLTLAYYRCPMLCGLVLEGLSKGIANLDFLPGRDFQMITVSINPAESYTLAAAKKKNTLAAIEKPINSEGWAFLTGAEENSKRLADALGFKYYYVEERKEYAHPAVSFFLTNEGIISRYLYRLN